MDLSYQCEAGTRARRLTSLSLDESTAHDSPVIPVLPPSASATSVVLAMNEAAIHTPDTAIHTPSQTRSSDAALKQASVPSLTLPLSLVEEEEEENPDNSEIPDFAAEVRIIVCSVDTFYLIAVCLLISLRWGGYCCSCYMSCDCCFPLYF